MKRLIGLAAVMAAAVILATGVQAFSAEKQDTYSFSAPGSWQYESPVESGNLPNGEDLSTAQTGTTDDFDKAAFGGVVYRIGIDGV
ncbi:MAG: hypothetical protein HY896_02300 [Deltaproteobacteria bacterium]|nr:hypothetical protein [Deltaproteobacteria bacterium]